MDTPWTPAATALLRELAERGLSTNEIAKELKMTKNQVVGKVHRERIQLKHRPVAIVPIESRPRGPAPSILPERLGCKWIAGEGWRDKARRGEDIFCGKRVAEVDGITQSYCPEHLRKVYVPKSKAKVA